MRTRCPWAALAAISKSTQRAKIITNELFLIKYICLFCEYT
jgi:hypothetical protein